MRNFLKSPALVLSALVLILSWSGLVAIAQTSRDSRSEKPSQAQPAPDATSVQGSQTPTDQTPAASQATPPSQATPQGQASPNTSAPPAHAAGQPPSIEDELQLTPDQKQKISAIVDDENRQITTVRDDQSMTMDQKIQKVQDIRKTGAPKIKAVLTPEQLQKLAVLQERARQQQQQNGNQAPPPPKQ